MSVVERLGKLSDRMFDAMRDRRAFTITDADATDGDFAALRGQAYALLVTFRANGEPVPTPVWIGIDDEGVAYVKTRAGVGKVRRIEADPRALLAPSNVRGRPTGPAVRATGRVLEPDRWDHAEDTLAAAYGSGRRLSERVLGGPEDLAAYLELRPRSPEAR